MGGKPSPCGKYLAFASDRDLSMPLGLFDLYVVRLGHDGLPVSGSKDGQFAAPKRLTWGIANQFSRSWSPDSRQLVFNSQVSFKLNLACKHAAAIVGSMKQTRIMCSGIRDSCIRPQKADEQRPEYPCNSCCCCYLFARRLVGLAQPPTRWVQAASWQWSCTAAGCAL